LGNRGRGLGGSAGPLTSDLLRNVADALLYLVLRPAEFLRASAAA